jgi:acid phosphatase family membrane protein YuiD
LITSAYVLSLWATGTQAEVLNIVLEELMNTHVVSEKKLKEVLGHTPLQVVVGATLGILVGCFVPKPAGF